MVPEGAQSKLKWFYAVRKPSSKGRHVVESMHHILGANSVTSIWNTIYIEGQVIKTCELEAERDRIQTHHKMQQLFKNLDPKKNISGRSILSLTLFGIVNA